MLDLDNTCSDTLECDSEDGKPTIRRMLFSRLKMDLHKYSYNDNITIIYKILRNEKILSIEARKSQSILNTSSQNTLYKYMCTQTSEHKAGKKNKQVFKCLDGTSNRLLLELLGFH